MNRPPLEIRSHHRLRLRIAAAVAAIVWAGVIFRFSALPASDVPGRFGSLAHFVEYLLLALLARIAADDESDLRGSAIFAVALASAYAVTDELHQGFVPGRVPDVMDWIVDSAGALTGAALASLALNRARRSGTRPANQ